MPIKKHIAEYAKSILNVSHAVHSIRSLYNLLSSYQNRHTVTYPGCLGPGILVWAPKLWHPKKVF